MDTRQEKFFTTIYRKDAKGKVRIFKTMVSATHDGSAELINEFGIIDGKHNVTRRLFNSGSNLGRANEKTPFDVAETEANHRIDEKMREGYAPASRIGLTDDSPIEKFKELAPTGAQGIRGEARPMFAPHEITKWERVIYPTILQPKMNGARCIMQVLNGNIEAISREGKSYNVAASTIIKELEPIFNEDSDIVLDGELYIHGMPLQRISGMVRTQQLNIEMNDLEYWIYDLAVPGMTQQERVMMMASIPFESLKKVKRVATQYVRDRDTIKRLHDNWVELGFEGAMIRDMNAEYNFGGRDYRMQKVKDFIDDEFTITGWKTDPGVEDIADSFVFELMTSELKKFYAKPRGSRYIRREYISKIQSLIGEKATVRYFELSEEKIPIHGRVIAIRNYE